MSWCLVLLYPTLAVPFCTWIMIGYFSSIPKELDEAALIDGASYLQILREKIFIPVESAGDHRGNDLRVHRSHGARSCNPLAYFSTSNQMVLTVGIISDLIHWRRVPVGARSWRHACWNRCRQIIIYAFLMDYYAGLPPLSAKINRVNQIEMRNTSRNDLSVR